MPKIRATQSISGVDFQLTPGDELEVSKSQAESWVEHGLGELVEGRETAAKKSRGGGKDAQPETR